MDWLFLLNYLIGSTSVKAAYKKEANARESNMKQK